MKLFGKIACALPKWMGGGHKRGKPVDRKEDFAPGPPHFMSARTHQTFECPRCHHETRYKLKEKTQ